MNKACSVCGEQKPINDFYKDKDKYMSSCKLCVREKKKERYWRNPEKYRSLSRDWVDKNTSRNRERAKKWYKNHTERGKIRAGVWKKENPEKVAINARKYSERHPDMILNKTHRRRAKKMMVEGGHFTESEWVGLLKVFGNKCLCCGRSDVSLERDHVVPLGPPHSDEITNIQPLCRSCNASKGNKVIDYRIGYDTYST